MPSDADLLFGQIALRKGYLNQSALEGILAEQSELEKDGIIAPLGKVLLTKNLLRPEQVEAILAEQSYSEIREEDKRLGVLAIKNGLVTEEQIQKALRRQKGEFQSGGKPGRLGDYLQELGFIDAQQVQAIVRLQERLAAKGKSPTGKQPAPGARFTPAGGTSKPPAQPAKPPARPSTRSPQAAPPPAPEPPAPRKSERRGSQPPAAPVANQESDWESQPEPQPSSPTDMTLPGVPLQRRPSGLDRPASPPAPPPAAPPPSASAPRRGSRLDRPAPPPPAPTPAAVESGPALQPFVMPEPTPGGVVTLKQDLPPKPVVESGFIGAILDTPAAPPPMTAPAPAPSFLLRVEQGDTVGRVIELRSGAILGRVSSVDIQIDDKKVSSKHASFEQQGDGWRMTDLGSRNGTQVNGMKVSGSIPLKPGDRIQIGGFILRFERVEPTGTPGPNPGGLLTADAFRPDPAPEPKGGCGKVILTLVLLLGILGAAAWVFRDEWMKYLPGNAPANESEFRVPVNKPPPKDPPKDDPRKLLQAELDGILAKMADPKADAAALEKQFHDLRQQHDPKGTDAMFDTIAKAFATRATDRQLDAWTKVRGQSSGLRKDHRYAEAIDLVAAFEFVGPSAEALAKQRADIIEATLNDAENYRVSLNKLTRDMCASGKADAAFVHIQEARKQLPEQFHGQLDELEKQLRAFLETLPNKGGNGAGSYVEPGHGPGEPDDGVLAQAQSGHPPAAGAPADPAAAGARAEAGQARLAQVKADLAARVQRGLELAKELAARVAGKTRANPIRVEISPDFTLDACVVSEYTAERVTLQSPQATLPLSWDALPARSAYEIRRLAIDDGSAEQHLTLGKYTLLRGLFDAAEREFKRALELDPALKSRIPDTRAFRERSRIFRGTWSQIGRDLLRVSWTFKSADEAEDFTSDSGKVAVVRNALEVAGQGVFMAWVREIDFADFVTVDASGYQGRNATPFTGLLFRDRQGVQTGLFVLTDPAGEYAIYRAVQNKLVPVQATKKMPKDAPVQVRLSDSRLEVRLKGVSVWTGAQEDFEQCWMVVGGSSEKGPGVARFTRVQVEGRAGAEWIRKSLSRMDTLALRQLEDDLRGVAVPTVETVAAPLSVDARLTALPAALRERYVDVRARIDRQDLAQPNDLWTALEDLAKAAPEFPGVWFARGRFLHALQFPEQAVPEYSKAIELDGGFYEALEARAGAWLDLSRSAEAQRDLDALFPLAPDLGRAHYHQARIRFQSGARAEAAADLELARALDPADADIRRFDKGVRNVLRGPLWKRTFRAETPHYVVRTDISQARAQFYAEQLETIGAFYAETFGVAQPTRPADALLFDTRESYQTYAELTLEDRVESTLGYYHPVYDQLLLFEDPSEGAGPETLRVLYHEGFHQFIHPVIPHLPYWLNEGMAEYFGASELRDGKVVRTGLVQPGRLIGLQNYLAKGGKPVAFDRIMLQAPREFYSGNVPLKYAQAWSMVHYFMTAGAGTYRRVLQTYVDLLRAGKSNPEAWTGAFGKLDLHIAEKQWLEAVKRMKVE